MNTHRLNRAVRLLCVMSLPLIGTANSAEDPASLAVVAQLTQRSGLPEATLQGLLSHCHVSQQTMYFCAWRDLLSADAKLDERAFHAGKAGPIQYSRMQPDLPTGADSVTKAARHQRPRTMPAAAWKPPPDCCA